MTLLFRWRWAAALVLACTLAIPSPLLAQADRNAEARVFFEQGNRALTRAMRTRGNRRQVLLQEALDSYFQSLRIVRSRNVIFNAGFALAELDRLDEAFSYYTEYLATQGLTEDELAEGRRRLEELRPRVALLAVSSDPSGAEVRIDRRDLASRGVTPLEVPVPAGEHRIFLTREGYEPSELTATAVVGERVSVQGTLAALPVSVVIRAPAGGRLTIDGRPVEPGAEVEVMPGRHTIRFEPALERVIEIEAGAGPQVIDLDVPDAPRGRGSLAFVANTSVRVSVDGVVVGEGRSVEATVPSGPHEVTVTAPGYAPSRSEIDLQPGEQLDLSVHMARSVSGESTLGDAPLVAWLATGILGLAAVGLSVNALLANESFEERSVELATNVDDPSVRVPGSNFTADEDQKLQELFDGVETANLVADIFWAATAVSGLAAIVFTILDRPAEQAPSIIQIGAAPIEGGGMLVAELPWRTP